MLTEKQLMHIEETAQVKDHKPYPDNAVELGSDVVMMMVEEIREYRDYQAETRPIVERVHEYTQKHGLLGWGNVIDALLADAERLRTVVAQQATEITALTEGYNKVVKMGLDTELEYERVVHELTNQIYALTVKVNNAKPDAAPAPVENAAAREIQVGDRVVTIYGHHGQVTRIDDGRPNPYTVRFAAAPTDSSEFFAGQYARNEIKPA